MRLIDELHRGGLRRLGKELLGRGLASTRLTELLCTFSRKAILIFTYHDFAMAPTESLANQLPAAELRSQLRWLSRECRVMTLSSALEQQERDQADQAGDVRPIAVISVDDGYSSVGDVLFPLARAEHLPFTFFVATDFVDSGRPPWPRQVVEILDRTRLMSVPDRPEMLLRNRREKGEVLAALLDRLGGLGAEERFDAIDSLRRELEVDLPWLSLPVSWPILREIAASGSEVGSHTVFHGWLPRLGTTEVREELVESKRRVELELGGACEVFAYPNGMYDPAVLRAVHECGYRYAVTQDWGENIRMQDPLTLRRLEVPFDESMSVFVCRARGVLWPKGLNAGFRARRG